MQYIDGIETNAPINSDNALVLGTALHTGIEKDVKTAIEQYFMSYPIIDDGHINEAIKLEHLIPKAKAVLPSGEYEVEIKDDDFHGFIDLLTPATVFERGVELPNVYDIYDFKYSNNANHYKDSRQLHLYHFYYYRVVSGYKTHDRIEISVDKYGDLRGIWVAMLDSFKDVTQVPIDDEKATEALEAKLTDIYANAQAPEPDCSIRGELTYDIQKKTLAKLETGEIVLYYMLDVDIPFYDEEGNHTSAGGIVELIVTLSD